mgnify:CR=1 FL=1
MNGDVLELPNLKDYYPLNAATPEALPRYYVVQDANYASEGFSQTWLPHIWRVKATPLTNAQEFKDILKKPMVNSTIWDSDNFYPQNSVVNYNNVYYRAITNTPAGTDITNTTYWTEYTPGTQDELMTTRVKDYELNDAILTQADVEVPTSGYDVKNYYIVPTVQSVPTAPPVWNLWDRDTAYKAGTVVNIDRQYWTAQVDVPPGVAINNLQYWAPYRSGPGGQPANPNTLFTDSNTTVDGTQGGMNVTPDGDGYRINGVKVFQTHATAAEVMLTYVRFGPGVGGIGSVLIPRNAEGFRQGKAAKFFNGEEWVQTYLDNVYVGPEDVLLKEGGFKKQIAGFNVERIGNTARSLALGRYAYEQARQWAMQRKQFGKLLCEFQGLQWKFADMKIKLDAGQLLIYRAVANAVNGIPSGEDTAIAKAFCNQAGFDICNEAMQIMGGMGYTEETLVEYCFRKCRGWMIAGGSIEILKNRIAEGVFERSFSQRPPKSVKS